MARWSGCMIDALPCARFGAPCGARPACPRRGPCPRPPEGAVPFKVGSRRIVAPPARPRPLKSALRTASAWACRHENHQFPQLARLRVQHFQVLQAQPRGDLARSPRRSHCPGWYGWRRWPRCAAPPPGWSAPHSVRPVSDLSPRNITGWCAITNPWPARAASSTTCFGAVQREQRRAHLRLASPTWRPLLSDVLLQHGRRPPLQDVHHLFDPHLAPVCESREKYGLAVRRDPAGCRSRSFIGLVLRIRHALYDNGLLREYRGAHPGHRHRQCGPRRHRQNTPCGTGPAHADRRWSPGHPEPRLWPER